MPTTNLTPEQRLAYNTQLELLEEQNKRVNSKLRSAIEAGQENTVSDLLNYPLTKPTTNELYSAVIHGHFTIVELLLRHKVNINLTGPNGIKTIHAAILKNDLKMVALLVQKGADYWTRDLILNTDFRDTIQKEFSHPPILYTKDEKVSPIDLAMLLGRHEIHRYFAKHTDDIKQQNAIKQRMSIDNMITPDPEGLNEHSIPASLRP